MSVNAADMIYPKSAPEEFEKEWCTYLGIDELDKIK